MIQLFFHRIKTAITLVVILNFYSTNLFAENDSYVAAFLDIPVGVRALGMGAQFTPIDNHDGTAFFWNPAAVSLTEGNLFSGLFSNQFGTIGDPLSQYFYFGYSQQLTKGFGFSLSWIRNSISDIPLTESLDLNQGDIGQILRGGSLVNGSFSNHDDALVLSLAKNIASSVDFGWQYFDLPIEFPIGINFKYIHQGFSGNSDVEYSGSGVGIDLGMLLKFRLGDFVSNKSYGDVAIGATVRDLFNTPISWNTDLKTKATITRSYLLSFSYKQPINFISSSLLFLISLDSKYDGTTSLGMEYKFQDILALRIGSYDENLTLGVGLHIFKAIYLDYAFQSHDLGDPHRVGLTANLADIF